jgi:predicted aspartyl protease
LNAYLILDTGATNTMVSRRIAHNLALNSVGYRKGYTVGGPVTRPVARLQSLKVGETEVKNLLVSIHDFHPNPQIEGLPGLDFFKNFHVSLDARKQLLILTPRWLKNAVML